MTGSSRERAIERLLAAPAGRSRDAIGPCVDAETVAAWLDGGVAGAAAERLEAHVATCASCQDVLAAVIRMTPVDAPALQAVPRRSWTAWGLPLAAAAGLVLAVWTTWPESSGPADSPALKEEAQMARAESSASVPVPESSVAAVPAVPGAQPAQRARSTPPAAAGSSLPAPPTAFSTPSADRLEQEAASAASAAARQPARAEDSAVEQGAVERSAEQQKAMVVVPSAPSASAASAPPAETAARQEASPPAAASEARARRADGMAVLARAPQVRIAGTARVAVQAPGALWRWRADRALEYSADGGATWRPSGGATAAQVTDILAGASPAPQTAWFVGRRGLVLLTTDGARVEVRTPAAAVDLVAVEATDQRTAIVRAASGESWRTTDGGRTWIAVARGQ